MNKLLTSIKTRWAKGLTPNGAKIFGLVVSALVIVALVMAGIGVSRFSQRDAQALEGRVSDAETVGTDNASAIAALETENAALEAQIAAAPTSDDVAALQAQILANQTAIAELESRVGALENPEPASAPAVSGSAGPCWTNLTDGQVWIGPADNQSVHIEGICPGADTSSAVFGLTNGNALAVFMTDNPEDCIWVGEGADGHLAGCTGPVVNLTMTAGEDGMWNVANPEFGRDPMTFGEIASLLAGDALHSGDNIIVFVAWQSTGAISGLWTP